MCTTHTRNMFNIHRKKIVIVACIVLGTILSFSAQSQIKRGSNYNYKAFSAKSYYFGITLGYNQSSYRLNYADDFILNDSIQTIQSIQGPGFNIGAIMNMKLGNYFDLRLMFPTLSFASKNITYTRSSNKRNPFTRKVNSTLLEIPFHVRYKSAPFHDKRLFLVAGVKYSYDLSSDSRTRQASSLIKISPTDFLIEVGGGIQFFMPYFIFSPEFKYSHGISNTLIYNGNIEESKVIEKIFSRTFTISLHFEG